MTPAFQQREVISPSPRRTSQRGESGALRKRKGITLECSMCSYPLSSPLGSALPPQTSVRAAGPGSPQIVIIQTGDLSRLRGSTINNSPGQQVQA